MPANLKVPPMLWGAPARLAGSVDLIRCNVCPGAPKLETIESRPVVIGATNTTRRRRKCPVCNNRFSTIEVPAEFAPGLFSED